MRCKRHTIHIYSLAVIAWDLRCRRPELYPGSSPRTNKRRRRKTRSVAKGFLVQPFRQSVDLNLGSCYDAEAFCRWEQTTQSSSQPIVNWRIRSYIAARTERIRLAPAVTVLPLHHNDRPSRSTNL